jgi:hypothetical protein
MEYKMHPRREFRHFVSAPFIYGMIIPFVILDVFIEVYHRVCFGLYKLPYVKRSDYIIFDRRTLSYLSWYDKINCTYCSYGNGLLLYASAIAAETEKYWCGIKHHNARIAAMLSEEKSFINFGDKDALSEIISEGKNNKD